MDKLQAKSALYTDYNSGKHGAADRNQPITLCERRGLTMHNLVVWDADCVNDHLDSASGLSLPAAGQATSNGNSSVLWAGPDRFLIVSTDSGAAQALSSLTDEQCALQDLSCARTVIRIQGEPCRHMMAKGLTVNLATDTFTNGQVILSSFDHHYPAIIHNVSTEWDAFDIYITRSFALSFWHWLCDSSLEFGCQVLEPER